MSIVAIESIDIGAVGNRFPKINFSPLPGISFCPIPTEMPFTDHLRVITTFSQHVRDSRSIGRN